MRRALEYVKAFGGVIAQHAQDPRLTEEAEDLCAGWSRLVMGHVNHADTCQRLGHSLSPSVSVAMRHSGLDQRQ